MSSANLKQNDKTFISINMDDDLKGRLNKLAVDFGRSRSNLCRFIFEDYIKYYEKRRGEVQDQI